MKKRKFIAAVAMGMLFAAGAQAQSSVQLLGLVDIYAARMRMAGDGAHSIVVNSGGMTTSWFGFKGTEDLGGGLRASFLLTAFFRADSGSPGRFTGDPFFSRDATVSLGSDRWGTVTVGRGLAPNFLPTVLFNPFGDSFTFSPLVLHNNVPLFNGTGWTASTPADTGWANEVIYTSPTLFGGLTANVHYQFGEQPDTAGPHNFGFNLLYSNGPLAATAFYERDDIANPVPAPLGDTRTDWMVGASYDFQWARFYGTYGRARSDVLVPRSRTATLGAAVPVGAGKVLAGIARTEVRPGGATRRTVTVGYDYNLSKSTDVYVMVMRDSITGFSSGTSAGAGIRKRF